VPDDTRAIDLFGRFCDMAREVDVEVGLEFMAFSSVRTLDHAMRIVRGAARRNGTLAMDVLHLMRNGVGPADIDRVAVQRAEIGYIQFCDGPLAVAPELAFDEATANRTPPGQGSFPLAEFLARMPAGRTLSVECPITRMRDAGLDAFARGKLLGESTRAVLHAIEGA
jgi:sugar phosphate isomerase/epimerase